jgi:hypothetical protein
MTEEFQPEQKQRWPGFKYEPVPGLIDRHISRYLRASRRNMMRFFHERRLADLEERMRQIRNSRQGMMAKNQMFQKVLNEYAQLVSPTVQPAPGETAPAAAPEAAHTEGEGAAGVVVPDEGAAVPVRGDGEVPTGSVPAVASEDGPGLVIEE